MPSGYYERTPEHKRRMSELSKQRFTPEVREKCRQRTLRQFAEDPTFKEKIDAGRRAWWAVPENRAKRKAIPGEAGFNHLYRRYKGAAKWRGLSFSLTREDVRGITKRNCEYCGAEPAQVCVRPGSEGSDYIYNGIDRVNNEIGYEIENVVPACGKCNSIKRAMTKKDFVNWIDTVYNHYVLPIKEKS